MIVEPDLPDGPYALRPGQLSEPGEMALGEEVSLVRMDTGRGQDGRELRRQGSDLGETLRLDQVGRAKNGDHPDSLGPPDDLPPVGVELGHIQMSVRVNEAE